MRTSVLPVLIVAVLLGLMVGCGDSGSGKKPAPSAGGTSGGSSATPSTPSGPVVGSGGGSKPQIGFIVRGDGGGYWKAVHAGAVKAMQEGRKGVDGKPVVEVLWQEPAKLGGQVDAAKELIEKHVAAIVVAPEDEASLVGVVAAAGRVPVVAMDTDLGVSGVKCAIGTGIKPLQLPDRNKVDGFGNISDDVAKLKANEIDALVVADPMELGTLALKTASDCIKEKKVEKRIDVPWYVVTKENVDSAEMAPLVNPPVGTYLKGQ